MLTLKKFIEAASYDKYKDKLSKEDFDRYLSIDPQQSVWTINSILKIPADKRDTYFELNKEQIKANLKKWYEITKTDQYIKSGKLQSKDINVQLKAIEGENNFDKLHNFIQNVILSVPKLSLPLGEKEYKVIYLDSDWLLIQVLTHEASVFFGRHECDGSTCVSMDDEDGESYFDSHTSDGASLMYLRKYPFNQIGMCLNPGYARRGEYSDLQNVHSHLDDYSLWGIFGNRESILNRETLLSLPIDLINVIESETEIEGQFFEYLKYLNGDDPFATKRYLKVLFGNQEKKASLQKSGEALFEWVVFCEALDKEIASSEEYDPEEKTTKELFLAVIEDVGDIANVLQITVFKSIIKGKYANNIVLEIAQENNLDLLDYTLYEKNVNKLNLQKFLPYFLIVNLNYILKDSIEQRKKYSELVYNLIVHKIEGFTDYNYILKLCIANTFSLWLLDEEYMFDVIIKTPRFIYDNKIKLYLSTKNPRTKQFLLENYQLTNVTEAASYIGTVLNDTEEQSLEDIVSLFKFVDFENSSENMNIVQGFHSCIRGMGKFLSDNYQKKVIILLKNVLLANHYDALLTSKDKNRLLSVNMNNPEKSIEGLHFFIKNNILFDRNSILAEFIAGISLNIDQFILICNNDLNYEYFKDILEYLNTDTNIDEETMQQYTYLFSSNNTKYPSLKLLRAIYKSLPNEDKESLKKYILYHIFNKMYVKETEKGFALAPYKLKKIDNDHMTLKDVFNFTHWVDFPNSLGIPAYLVEDDFYTKGEYLTT